MPHYLRYRIIQKECVNEVDDGNGGTRKCGVTFTTTNPMQKYCKDCKATKPWAVPAIKRL